MVEKVTIEDLLNNQLLRLDKEFHTIPAKELERLPVHSGGVYTFLGEDLQPLYVGLTDNISRRISAHLNGGGSPDIFQYNRDLLHLNYFEEDNSLYRDIYESYLIYTLKPRYNVGKTGKTKLLLR